MPQNLKELFNNLGFTTHIKLKNTIALCCVYAILAVIGSYTLYVYYSTNSQCFWRQHFNLYCGTCGGTHMVLYLLQGNIITALSQNPYLFIFTPIAAILTIVFTIRYIQSNSKLYYITITWIIYAIGLNLYGLIRNLVQLSQLSI